MFQNNDVGRLSMVHIGALDVRTSPNELNHKGAHFMRRVHSCFWPVGKRTESYITKRHLTLILARSYSLHDLVVNV